MSEVYKILLAALPMVAALAVIVGFAINRRDCVAELIADPQSCKTLILNLRETNRGYRKYLSKAIIWIDAKVEVGLLSYFSFLFFALIYCSFSFILSWAVFDLDSSSFYQNPQNKANNVWLPDERLFLFATILGATRCVYVLSKSGQDIVTFLLKISKNNNLFVVSVSVLISFLPAISIYFLTKDIVFSSVIFIFSFIPSLFSGEVNEEQELLYSKQLKMAACAAFGPVALFIVIFSLISGETSDNSSYAASAMIVLIAILSGGLTYYACKVSDGRYDNTPNISRASISMGLYIANNHIGFMVAVTIAAIVPIFFRLLNISDLSIPVSVLLSSAIFLAGGRTLAGCGYVIGVVLLAVSFALLLESPENFYAKWFFPTIFWTVLPFVNALFDVTTWSISRYFALRISRGTHSSIITWLVVDTIIAAFLIAFLVATLSFIVSSLEYHAELVVGTSVFVLEEFLDSIEESLWINGSWVFFLIFSTFLPTLGHAIVAIIAGVDSIVTQDRRNCLADCLEATQKPLRKVSKIEKIRYATRFMLYGIFPKVISIFIGFILLGVIIFQLLSMASRSFILLARLFSIS